MKKLGIEISEGLVERVKIQILREQRRTVPVAHAARKVNRIRKRRGMQKVPEKRPWRK